MKYIFLLFSFLLVSCQSGVSTNSERLTYEKIKSLKIGIHSADQAQALFGTPSSTDTDDTFYTTRYIDPASGANRLTLNFSKKNKVLENIIWIPKSSDKEVSLDAAKESFKGASFKTIQDTPLNSHALDEGGVSYVDEKSGVTIRYDKRLKEVEAIAIYSTEKRIPAREEKSAPTIPYSL